MYGYIVCVALEKLLALDYELHIRNEPLVVPC